jgi:hypothetical protein
MPLPKAGMDRANFRTCFAQIGRTCLNCLPQLTTAIKLHPAKLHSRCRSELIDSSLPKIEKEASKLHIEQPTTWPCKQIAATARGGLGWEKSRDLVSFLPNQEKNNLIQCQDRSALPVPAEDKTGSDKKRHGWEESTMK